MAFASTIAERVRNEGPGRPAVDGLVVLLLLHRGFLGRHSLFGLGLLLRGLSGGRLGGRPVPETEETPEELRSLGT